ncbi:hypothetical protein L596_028783 [Steinernema carpocapsae]|uniref:Small ribosomal subunit protein mS33 n=1 Tax=Steinernema carpocapsae TaxID=34508 RepID=A0A4U5M0E7_STECR|nr:hypothetical protein L596_028783 [Steinernema carpocapsae]
MVGRVMASRISHVSRGISADSAFGKRMDRLSNRIFGEVVRPTDVRSMKVVRVLTADPLDQREDKGVGYFPNQPMFHYLTKMLRLHGLYQDDHVIWRQIQDEQKSARGKVVSPPIGQGKRAQLRGKK